jgi:uncharacterized protein YcgI (DUF1989 family)
MLTESNFKSERASCREIVDAGAYYIGVVKAGETFRIVDIEGNQAADTLFFNASNTSERYSAMDTIREQGNVYLTTDSELRYDLEKRCMHACRDSWMLAIAENPGYGISKRDISHNINFFMNVPITTEGGLTFEDGISAPGKYIELRAEIDVIVLISNCPQLNNPCNGYNPTPVEFLVWAAP